MRKKIIFICSITIYIFILICCIYANSGKLDNIDEVSSKVVSDATTIIEEAEIVEVEEVKVYDGLSMSELTEKLNLSLKSTIAGTGDLYAKYSLEYGVDPYLAVAISLHETGCNRDCSVLVKKCNNVGGQKGSPKCGNGSYKRYDTLEKGIEGFIKNIAKNYYAYGLNTPELMQKKYAASASWAAKVNRYIDVIKAKEI